MSEQDLAVALADHPVVTIGRYILHRQIARGGMATIHIARLMGDEGFSRIVAAKRLLPEFAEDSEFVAMFLDEARIASKVHHRNVVPVLDVVTAMDEVVLVQEYVHGAPLHWLLNRARQARVHVPIDIAVSIATQVLAGLHAAHTMVDEMGMPLDVVHRDVSPQNVMIGTDGTARLLDFGVAKATMAAHVTREGTYKGKLAYSAPEQLRGMATRQSDLYSLSVLLWELLVGHRMHGGQDEAALITKIMSGSLPTITESLAAEYEWSAIDEAHWKSLAAIEPIVKRGLAVDLSQRWTSASEMEDALVAVMRPASSGVVATWLKDLGKDYLEKHDKVLAAEEASWRRTGQGQSSVRRTPIPGELRRPVTVAEEPSVPPAALPAAPMRRGPYALVALLSVLVIALAMGIVLIVRSPSAQQQASASTPPPQPPPPAVQPVAPPPAPAAAPAAAPVEPSPPPVAAQPEPPPPPAVDSISIGAAESHPINNGPSAGIARKTVVRQAPPVRQPPVVVRRAPPAEPKPPPAAEPAAQPATQVVNCNPPYYFEGPKKIFKPACL
jgi:serine/threonine-protein kinase